MGNRDRMSCVVEPCLTILPSAMLVITYYPILEVRYNSKCTIVEIKDNDNLMYPTSK